MPRPKPNKDELLKDYITCYGYTIIDDGEKDGRWNACSQIKVKCHKNEDHVFTTCITNLKRGKLDISEDCPHCKKEKRYEQKGIHKNVVEEYCQKYNVDYLPKKEYYNRWEDSITFICKKDGFKFEVKSLAYWENHQQPFICEECNKPIILEIPKIEEVQFKIKEKHNYYKNIILPETKWNVEPTSNIKNRLVNEKTVWHVLEYNGTRNKAKVICKSCGHEKESLIGNIFGRSSKCIHCFQNKQKFKVEDKIIDICKDNHFTLKNNFYYRDTKTPINFICQKCGNTISKSWAEITGMYYNLKCEKCYPKGKSLKEIELYEWVKSIYKGNVESGNREIIKPLEIDVYIPDKKIAIEFCGNVWHSTKYMTDYTYHENKMKQCNDKGITLITFYEDEWDDKKDICKNIIKNKIIGANERIYGRECVSKKINDVKMVKEFLNKNHIQGSCSFDICYGLYHKEELVEIITIKKARKSQKHDYELNRMCSKLDTIVIGGASKLLKFFTKEYHNIKLSTFADLRVSNGNVYEKMGFYHEYNIRPRYSYVGNETKWKRKHRFGFSKKRLMEKYGNDNLNLSEKQITEKVGLYRLYDCGYKKFSIMI